MLSQMKFFIQKMEINASNLNSLYQIILKIRWIHLCSQSKECRFKKQNIF